MLIFSYKLATGNHYTVDLLGIGIALEKPMWNHGHLLA